MTHEPREGKTGLRWFPLNAGTALILATVISLLTFVLLSDGSAPTAAATRPAAIGATADVVDEGASSSTAEATAPVATTVGPVEVSRDSALLGGGDGDAAFAGSTPEEGEVAITPVVVSMNPSEFGPGPTEVAVVTNFPALDYTWERVELQDSSFFEMSWIGELDGRLIAVSAGWDEVGDGPGVQTLATWTSEDGLDWTQAGSVQMPEQTWVVRIAGGPDRIYAVGEDIAEDGSAATHVLMTSPDGAAWTTRTLPVSPNNEQDWVYVQDAAAGPQGVAISLQYEAYRPEPPQRLVFDDFEVEIDPAAGQYILSDATTGAVLLAGPLTEIYQYHGEEGQVVIDPATGEILTIVPWEVWEQAYSSVYEDGYEGSPLPVPIESGGPYEPPVVTVEHDGFLITIDEGLGTFSVAVAAGGTILVEGPLDELYQGPPPRLIDPATGEVVFSVTWDEWYQAEERSWESYEYEDPEFRPTSRTSILTSPDGETWSEKDFGEGPGGAGVSLTATDDGFIAVETSYEEYGETRTIWTMRDGIWTETPAEQSQLWLYSIIHTGNGFFGIGDGPTGQAVWSSSDAISWSTEFATAPQDDGAHVWLSNVASDGEGLVAVLATQESYTEYQPLAIEQDKYTAVFEDEEVVVEVTENASGEPVLALTWEDFDRAEGAYELITRDGETTVFQLDNGDVMVITDEEAESAVESRFGAESGAASSSVFLKSGNSWSEVVVDSGGGIGGGSQLFISDGRIIIAGTDWGAAVYSSEIPETSAVVLVGTPAGSA